MVIPLKFDLFENQISAFNGLTEKDVIQLYNIGKLLSLNANNVIFKEGDIDKNLYILLSGSIKLTKTTDKHSVEIIIQHKGSFIDENAFKSTLYSAVALEPSTILVFNEKSFEVLPHHIQIIILKNLSRFAAFNVQNLRQQIAEKTDIITSLVSYTKELYLERNNLCSQAQIIQSALKSFPRLPVYAMKLTELLLDEKVPIDRVIELAKADPSLVAAILKTVNSPFYNFPHNISDFEHAVMFLGFNKIYQTVIDSSINDIMPQTEEFYKFRSHSLLIASLAFETAMQCKMHKPLIMNTIGMLHNIGKITILLLNKKQLSNSIISPMLDDAMIGALLLKEWNLPDKICLTIEYYHFPEFAPPEEIPLECRDMVSILYLARLLYDYTQRKKEKEIGTIFLGKYLKALDIKTPFRNFAKEYILPSIRKRADTLPLNIRAMLDERAI